MLNQMWREMSQACFGTDTEPFTEAETETEAEPFTETGQGHLPSVYAVSDFASATVGMAGAALSRAMGQGPAAPNVTVDRRLASLWFDLSLTPVGWEAPSIWDAIAGVYRTQDGWIRLHTNAPHHRAAALSVLKCDADRSAVAEMAARWTGEALQDKIVAAKGCAAAMLDAEAWAAHPQGRAVAAEPLIAWDERDRVAPRALTSSAPLQGVKVLDLTRVLAGPVATRFLAGFGAHVLRIDPPHWNEPAAEMEVTLGKRCAGLDLRLEEDRARLTALLTEADILVHGYRNGALDGLGFGAEARRALNPALVDISLNAYGWTGPWAQRRGFDSLVQMSCGIAARGQAVCGTDGPKPLPVQALDHGTGYLLAAAAVTAWTDRCQTGRIRAARLSLARTAECLKQFETPYDDTAPILRTPEDTAPALEHTTWGPAFRLAPPLTLAGTPPHWTRPAGHLRRNRAVFV